MLSRLHDEPVLTRLQVSERRPRVGHGAWDVALAELLGCPAGVRTGKATTNLQHENSLNDPPVPARTIEPSVALCDVQ